MLCPQKFYNELRKNEIHFFTGVPDSLLKSLCAYITDNVSEKSHIIAANEGGAIALAMGYHLATGKIPLIYMQNSGLGNAINPLLSLADPDIYSVPMLLVLGWRGQPGTKDEPQHRKQGKVMLAMLEAMEIPFLILSNESSIAAKQLQEATESAKKQSCPFAIIVEKDTFESYSLKNTLTPIASLTREEAINCVVSHLTPEDIVVATTGMAGRELFEIRKAKGYKGDSDFLTIGGMGHASQIALGLAIQQPNRRVYCIDGDGAILMHMGSLAIIGQLQCSNLIHIAINNGAHDSVGGQPTAAASLDLTKIAQAVGYHQAYSASSITEISKYLNQMSSSSCFLEIKTKIGARSDLGRPTTTPGENKDKLMSFIQCA